MLEPVFVDWRDQHRLHGGSVHFTEDVFIGRSKDQWKTPTLTSEHRYAERDSRRDPDPPDGAPVAAAARQYPQSLCGRSQYAYSV